MNLFWIAAVTATICFIALRKGLVFPTNHSHYFFFSRNNCFNRSFYSPFSIISLSAYSDWSPFILNMFLSRYFLDLKVLSQFLSIFFCNLNIRDYFEIFSFFICMLLLLLHVLLTCCQILKTKNEIKFFKDLIAAYLFICLFEIINQKLIFS